MNDKNVGKSRLNLGVLALVFFGPLLVAIWMYSTGQLNPASRSNHGALLEPVINIGDVLPGSPVTGVADGRWLMLYAYDGACDDGCREGLYRLRQTRLMLGSEIDRVVRVFLHGDTPPDTVFLESEHAGLVTISDEELARLLAEKRPGEAQTGGIYLLDPLGNLVMYFPPDLDPRDVIEDIEHLLDLSRIG